MSTDQNGSIVGAMFWMFLISLLLFWLPVIGPLLAGVVGGKKAGARRCAHGGVLAGDSIGYWLVFVGIELEWFANCRCHGSRSWRSGPCLDERWTTVIRGSYRCITC